MSRSSSRSSSPDVNRQPPKSSLKEFQVSLFQSLLQICAIDPSEIRTQLMYALCKEKLSTDELIFVSQNIERFKTLFLKPEEEVNVFLQALNYLDEDEGLPDFDEEFQRLSFLVATLKAQSSLLMCEALLRSRHQQDEVHAYSFLTSDQQFEFSQLQAEFLEREMYHNFESNLDYDEGEAWRLNNGSTFSFFPFVTNNPEEKNQSLTENTFIS